MAKLTKIKDARLRNPDQYRLRYTIYFPDGGRRDRSRRYRTSAVARAISEIAIVVGIGHGSRATDPAFGLG